MVALVKRVHLHLGLHLVLTRADYSLKVSFLGVKMKS